MSEFPPREGLLDAETASAELEKSYRQAILGLVERRLTPAQRRSNWIGVAVSVVLVYLFVAKFLQLPPHPAPAALAGLALGLLFAIGWGLLSLASLRSGRESLRFHAVLRTQLIFVFTALLMGLMLWAGIASADPLRGIRMILYGVVFFVGIGIPYFIAQVARQSELRVREDLVRLELLVVRAAGREPGGR